jgi:hypothetical protein
LSPAGRAPNALRIHRLLAAKPLPPLNEVYREIFEQILGQRVAPPSPELAQAERDWQLAKQKELPLLLVLFKKTDKAGAEHEWHEALSRDAPEASRLKALSECYVVVHLSLDLLPALSQHLGLRPFAAPDGGSPLFVIARSDGRQLSATTGWEKAPELARLMAQGAVQEAKERPRTKAQLTRLMDLVEPIDADLTVQVRELRREAPRTKS